MSNRIANTLIGQFANVCGISFINAQKEGRVKRHHSAGGDGFYVYSKDRETVIWFTLLEATPGSLGGGQAHGRWRVEVEHKGECIFSGSHIMGAVYDFKYAAKRVMLSKCDHVAEEILGCRTYKAEKVCLGLPL